MTKTFPIAHREFNVDEAAVNEMRPHYEVKIKELDEELIKKAARTLLVERGQQLQYQRLWLYPDL